MQDKTKVRKRFGVIMAAGEGTRMKSSRPKPLVRICGKPMVLHILEEILKAGITDVVVVVGFRADVVRNSILRLAPAGMHIEFVEQKAQRGTGDALATAMTALPDPIAFDIDAPPMVLVVPGDTPLIRAETIEAIFASHVRDNSALSVSYTDLLDPSGYGRVIFGKDEKVLRIVEHKDATIQERDCTYVNSSIYVANLDVLSPALRRLNPSNVQGEYYLTDVVEILAKAGYHVSGYEISDPDEALGVNDRRQLASAEAKMRERINASFMLKGVNLVDPNSIYIDSTVEIGQDTTIWPGTFLIGQTTVGRGAEIGPEVRISDSVIQDGAKVVRSDLEGCRVGEDAIVGPYAVLRSGVKIDDSSKSGSFVVLE
ncbi:sugar phosphate nucleotidyltransferase [Acidithrix sp. C25]|uniref:bifunctional UDP-N-acetylglucosamine diphosphorylase/glucosamine-1-phosphate N-acetyltransferase GlmU n=1 Tax=Acidithrix sp. C25 TaxID=1671482 RepID=UPI00191B97E9|nr:sugar phosphate nucleotidyltransferase [Acidithrix sp. C25]CAG4924215.1 unnamed protein product [Acidithrix sp. C25]